MKQPNETNGTNPKDIILEEEFNWNKYQQKVLDKWVNKCGTIEQAVVDMDAKIASLQVEADSLREMINWDDDMSVPIVIGPVNEEEE